MKDVPAAPIGPLLRRKKLIPLAFLAALGCALPISREAPAQSPATPSRPPQAPPTAPPALEREALETGTRPLQPQGTLMQYSIGDPTDEEQLYVEFINRARADPPAEAIRLRDTTDPDVLDSYDFFDVDLDQMVTDISAIDPVPPLSINAKLTSAARRHTMDMFDNAFQGHTGTDDSSFGSRATDAGYNWTTIAENVFSFTESVFHGHAGFEVDWGDGPFGMQDPPGHRINIHNPNVREVGIGVVLGENTVDQTTVGPQLVTQEFATESGSTPFITGVAYYDLNANGFYDLGEGLSGVRVDVSGSSFFAATSDSGGYSVPVPGNDTYTVSFSGTDLTTTQTPVTVSNGENVKLDFTPTYSPPSVSGPSDPIVGINNTYGFTSVGGATAYEWRRVSVSPFTDVEGAENGTANVTLDISSYDPIVTDDMASGSSAFRLAHPEAVDQFLQLNANLRVSASSELHFFKRLGFATTGQVARAQVSVDDGVIWQDVWSQAGDGDSQDSSLILETVSLAGFAGESIRIRFVYDHTGGTFFPQTDPGIGFYLDDIAVTDADVLTDETIATAGGTSSFEFNPPGEGTFLLTVRAINNNRIFPFGPALEVSAAATPVIVIDSVALISGGTEVQLGFTVTNPSSPNYELLRAFDPAGPYSADLGVSVQEVSAGHYTATASTSGGNFLRLSTDQ